jgi:hypothetical protein
VNDEESLTTLPRWNDSVGERHGLFRRAPRHGIPFDRTRFVGGVGYFDANATIVGIVAASEYFEYFGDGFGWCG